MADDQQWIRQTFAGMERDIRELKTRKQYTGHCDDQQWIRREFANVNRSIEIIKKTERSISSIWGNITIMKNKIDHINYVIDGFRAEREHFKFLINESLEKIVPTINARIQDLMTDGNIERNFEEKKRIIYETINTQVVNYIRLISGDTPQRRELLKNIEDSIKEQCHKFAYDHLQLMQKEIKDYYELIKKEKDTIDNVTTIIGGITIIFGIVLFNCMYEINKFRKLSVGF